MANIRCMRILSVNGVLGSQVFSLLAVGHDAQVFGLLSRQGQARSAGVLGDLCLRMARTGEWLSTTSFSHFPARGWDECSTEGKSGWKMPACQNAELVT